VSEALKEIIDKLWIAPENAEWTRKTDVVSLSDVREWTRSSDIEILGFTHALIHDSRFRIEPVFPLTEYTSFVKHYFERCLREDPEGDWADSSYSAGGDLVNIFASLWRDSSVPREVVKELKDWLGQLYREGDKRIRTCIETPLWNICLSGRKLGISFLIGKTTPLWQLHTAKHLTGTWAAETLP
jgi:hypothetical protein